MEMEGIRNDELEGVMKLAVGLADETMKLGIGGPFGAAVIDKEGKIVSVASNTVLRDDDPTAHAEINAIRQACKELGTHDLTGCTLLATGFPCPMCLSAIIWANIKKVYYGCTPKEAEKIGFRDDFIYKYIEDGCDDTKVLNLEQLGHDDCIQLFIDYHQGNKQLY